MFNTSPNFLKRIGPKNLGAKRKSKSVKFSVKKLCCEVVTYNSLFTYKELNFWYLISAKTLPKLFFQTDCTVFSRFVGLEKQKVNANYLFIWKEFSSYIITEKVWADCVFEFFFWLFWHIWYKSILSFFSYVIKVKMFVNERLIS